MSERIELRKVAIVAKPHIKKVPSVVQSLADWLEKHEIEPLVEERIAHQTGEAGPYPLPNSVHQHCLV